MAESKFRDSIVGSIREEQKKEKKQEKLRNRYSISDGEARDVMIVEKKHLAVDAVKALLSVIVYLLAFTGLLCLVYPTTREALGGIFRQIAFQLGAYF